MNRTPEELATLKRQWKEDPCWDIETTPGFEAHADELLAYRRQVEAETDARIAREAEREAKDAGCPSLPTLGHLIRNARLLRDYARDAEHLDRDARAYRAAVEEARLATLRDLAPVLESFHQRLRALELD